MFTNRMVGLLAVHFEDQPMLSPKPFGRRVNLQHEASRTTISVESAARPEKAKLAEVANRPASPIPLETGPPTLYDDLPAWKQNRKRGFSLPWRPLLLMASLCFGIASFVLPDTVNNAAQWLLWALTFASLIAWTNRPNRAI